MNPTVKCRNVLTVSETSPAWCLRPLRQDGPHSHTHTPTHPLLNTQLGGAAPLHERSRMHLSTVGLVTPLPTFPSNEMHESPVCVTSVCDEVQFFGDHVMQS